MLRWEWMENQKDVKTESYCKVTILQNFEPYFLLVYQLKYTPYCLIYFDTRELADFIIYLYCVYRVRLQQF